MLNSDYRKLCAVTLPYQGRQKYMHTFDLSDPRMADGFEDYLDPVVRLCEAAGAKHGLAHMTVDEKIITPGMSQRRPKPHVDGCFMPQATVWGHGGRYPGWTHVPTPGWSHGNEGGGGGWDHGGGGWAHGCNNIPLSEFKRMPVIIAASAVGCRAWRGVFDGEPKSDGDLSHLDLSGGEILPANMGYLLSPDCVHESMIHLVAVQRSFLRIALPVEFEF